MLQRVKNQMDALASHIEVSDELKPEDRIIGDAKVLGSVEPRALVEARKEREKWATKRELREFSEEVNLVKGQMSRLEQELAEAKARLPISVRSQIQDDLDHIEERAGRVLEFHRRGMEARVEAIRDASVQVKHARCCPFATAVLPWQRILMLGPSCACSAQIVADEVARWKGFFESKYQESIAAAAAEVEQYRAAMQARTFPNPSGTAPEADTAGRYCALTWTGWTSRWQTPR